MIAEQLTKIISGGEGLTVEFKRCENGLTNTVFETVSSFSNRYGGHLLLGVDDAGRVTGVNRKAAAGIKKNFANTLNNPQRFSPTLFLTLEEAEIDGRLVLWAYVPANSQVVMFAGKIYDRNEDGDADISRNSGLVAQIHAKKSRTFSERKIFPYARESDLDIGRLMPKVRRLVKNRREDHPWLAMGDGEIMRSAGLYQEDFETGKAGFNLAAILLFGREEAIRACTPNYLTDALARRENVDRYDDRLVVTSNLIDAYESLIEFINKHTLDRFFLIGGQSVSVRSKIARELVGNSLVHREYTSAYPAKIVITRGGITTENWSIPRAPGRIDPDRFTPYPKNPLLANFFVQIGRADTLGSGVRNLYKFTKIYSGREPELVDGDVFRTIVPLTGPGLPGTNGPVPGPDGTDLGTDLGTDGTDLGTDGTDLGTDGTDLGTDGTDPCARGTHSAACGPDPGAAAGNGASLLEALRQNPDLTYDEMAGRLSLPRRTLSRELKALREQGKIRRVGNNRTGRWEVIGA